MLFKYLYLQVYCNAIITDSMLYTLSYIFYNLYTESITEKRSLHLMTTNHLLQLNSD